MFNIFKRLNGHQWFGILLVTASLVGGGVGLNYVQQDAGEKDVAATEVKHIASTVVEEPKIIHRFGIDESLLRKIDFAELQSQNSDATRWLYVPGTAIDAPVMQEQKVGSYFYDLRGVNKAYNGCGSFLVPAEPIDKNTGKPADDAHTLILGHRMNAYNGEWQFSNLPTRWGAAQGAADYPYVYVYYPDHAERLRVWGALDAWADDMIYDIPYELGSDDYQKMLDHVSANIRYKTGEAPDKDTRITMLSTCNRPNGGALMRFVLVTVPDAYYYYDNEQYVNADDKHAFDAWKESNAEAYAKAVSAVKKSNLLDGGAGLSEASTTE